MDCILVSDDDDDGSGALDDLELINAAEKFESVER